jgi:ABC-type amino acid transport substrate-binding protein
MRLDFKVDKKGVKTGCKMFVKAFGVLLLSCCFLSSPALAQKKQSDSYCPSLKAGIVVAYPPFSWTTQEALPISGFKTVLHGFYKDFLKQVLSEAVYDGHFSNIVTFSSYDDAFNALTENRIDVLSGIYYNADVAKYAQPIYPAFYNNTFRALFKNGKEKPLSELKNLKGAVIEEEEVFWYEMLPFVRDKVQNVEIMESEEAFLALLSGDIDFILSGQIFGQSQIERFALEQEVSFSKEVFRNPNVFIAVRKKDFCPAARQALEKQLRRFEQEPSLFYEMISSQLKKYKELFENNPPLTVKEK